MTTTYTKSLPSDFSGNLHGEQLKKEINSTIITPNCIVVKNTGDDVDIIFESALSAGQQTTLDNLISNHSPNNNTPKNNLFTYTPRTTYSSSLVYQRVGGPFKYQGSDNVGNIDYIEVVAYKDALPTSYDVRIYDSTNGTVLAESTGLTNTDEQIIDLGTISNIPSGPSLLEVQVKQSGGTTKNVYLEQVLIYFDN